MINMASVMEQPPTFWWVNLNIHKMEDSVMRHYNLSTEFKRRAESIKLPKGIQQCILADIIKWSEKSGLEWTTKRLKALKVDFIRLSGGQDPSSEWVQYTNGYPKGSFGKLFRWGHLNPKHTAAAIQLLSVYTLFVHSNVTDSQESKFYGSVCTEPLDEDLVEEFYSSTMSRLVEKLVVRKKKLQTVRDYIPSGSKRCPTSNGGTMPELLDQKSHHENDVMVGQGGWLDTIDVLWDTSLGRQLYHRYPSIRQVVKPVESLVLRKLSKLPPYFFEEGDRGGIRTAGFVGKIGHIQEPGLKLRAVANPFRVYQLALSRLGAQLYELLTTLSWDVTHDQDSGVAWAQQKLREGNTMFAVDLSDATNVFPLSLQLKVLKGIDGVLEEDINLFETLSKAPWLSPSRGLVKWTKGQPLGLFPSFASFALTHGLLVASLEKELGLHEGDNFRVLGDDIVISDLRLNRRYREVLSMLEVGVSESKTLTSNQVTEFGGRVIFPDQIISAGKWREISDRSFIDLLRNVGPGYIKYLRPRQRKVAEKIITLPHPWGLNMNPLGLSAYERHCLAEAFLDSLELDFPEFQKDSWTRTLMTSKLASPKFPSTSLNEYIHSPGFKAGRQTSSKSQEPLVRISHSTGVDIQPSLQFADSDVGYTDILERVHSTARSLGLITKRSSDPRGRSTLEILEDRLRRVNVL